MRDHDAEMQEVLAELRRIEHDFGRRMDEMHHEQNRKIDKLSDKVDSINGHVADVLMEVGGAPDRRYRDPNRRPLRDRVHTVEDEMSLYKEIADALVARADQEEESREQLGMIVTDLQRERERMTILNDDRERRSSSWRERVRMVGVTVGILAGCIAATFTMLNYFTG